MGKDTQVHTLAHRHTGKDIIKIRIKHLLRERKAFYRKRHGCLRRRVNTHMKVALSGAPLFLAVKKLPSKQGAGEGERKLLLELRVVAFLENHGRCLAKSPSGTQ